LKESHFSISRLISRIFLAVSPLSELVTENGQFKSIDRRNMASNYISEIKIPPQSRKQDPTDHSPPFIVPKFFDSNPKDGISQF
jgi:hypothetical protein